jgi:hypothetical protein
MDVKPELERKCSLDECKPEDFDIGVIITNTVVGISHWRIGPWSAVSENYSFEKKNEIKKSSLVILFDKLELFVLHCFGYEYYSNLNVRKLCSLCNGRSVTLSWCQRVDN